MGSYETSGDSSNNTINIKSGEFFGMIYGGYSESDNASTSGNVLNVYNKDIFAQNVSNFDKINFYIPNDATNGDTLLTLSSSEGTDLSDVSINAGVVAGNSNLAVGDKINLLTNENGLTTNSATSYGTLSEGVSLDYGLTVSNSGNSVVATIDSISSGLNESTKALPLSTGITGLAIADNVLDSKTLPEHYTIDFEEEEDSAKEFSDVPIVEPKGREIFANMGGGSLRRAAARMLI